MMEQFFYIRPSSLTSWGDCPRRAAASLFKRYIMDAGYDLRSSLATIASGVGTSVHAAGAHLLEAKMETGSLGARDEAEQCGVDTLKQIIEDGIGFDDTSPNRNVAERQVVRMTRVFHKEIAPKVDPIAVEVRLEADTGDNFILSGQSDLIAREPDFVRDLKTGVVSRTHAPQLGAYAILEASHGRELSGAAVDFIRRVRIDAEQPPVESTYYPLEEIVPFALHRINRVKRELTDFLERLESGSKAPEWAFDVNPMSMLCSEKFCAAYGTDFCNEWKYKEKSQ